MHVDPVSQRTGDPPRIPLDVCRRAGAGSGWITQSPTGTGIRGADQCEARGKLNRARHPGDHNAAVFHRLSKTIEHEPGKLEHLVEKENAVVREAHFPGPRLASATDQSRA